MVKHIKQGDDGPYVRATLGIVRNGVRSLTDLTDSVVRFIMRKKGQSSAAVSTVLSSPEIIDVTNGQVEYQWRDGETDVVGDYLGEFEVTDSGGKKLTYWDLRTANQVLKEVSPEPLTIRIVDDLG